MNILYTSQKLHELFCDDSLPNHAKASGDGDGVPGRCCRLCGGDNNLRYFGDTYVWQGVEERYDQLLNDCFGVKVTPSDCMICEWCVRALRTTGRFRALVHAAFDEQNSDGNEAKKAWEKLRNNHRDALRRQSKPKSGSANIRPWRFQDNMAFLIPHMANRYTNTSEDVQNDDTSQVSSNITLKSSTCMKRDLKFAEKPEKDPLPTKSIDLVKKRDDLRKRFLTAVDSKPKRTNIPCDVCKQRYPMLMNARDTYKKFVCSRCKKINGELKSAATCGKCNVVMPGNLMAEHMELHVKADLRGKYREQQERKRAIQPPLPRKVIPPELMKARPQKYQCSQCAKKYTLARQLAMHVRNAHGDTMDNICAVCNEDMETNKKLQEHLLQHSGLHQCDECLLIFKNKKILAAHITKHHVGYTATLDE